MVTIKKIWITDTAVFVEDAAGRVASEQLSDYARLKNATREQLDNYETDNIGIHWKDLDEDLSFDGFFTTKTKDNVLFNFFKQHSEINASAIARRLGIKQSLLAAYINGTKKPSKDRMKEIISEIKKTAQEIYEYQFV